MIKKARHLLLICYNFAPFGGSAGIRASKLAKYAVKAGLKVTVLTGAVGCRHVFMDPELVDEVRGTNIIRVSDGSDTLASRYAAAVAGDLGERVFVRLMARARLGWQDKALQKGLSSLMNDPPDVVLATGPPVSPLVTGSGLAAQFGRPLILDFRDPPWELIPAKTKLIDLANKGDLVVVNTPRAARFIAREHPGILSAVEAWTNGSEPLDEVQMEGQERQPGQKLKITYAGGVYPEVLEFCHLLRDTKIFSCRDVEILGFQEKKRTRVLGALSKMGCAVRKPVGSSQLDFELTTPRILLVALPEGYGYRVPLKTYNAVRSGNPILMFGVSGATKEVLNKIPGIFWATQDVSALELDDLLNSCSRYNPYKGWKLRRPWTESHTWEAIFNGIFERYL